MANRKREMMFDISRDQLIELHYGEGLSYIEMAERLYVSYATIQKYMKIYGIKGKVYGNRKAPLYDVGNGRRMTSAEIAKIAGVSPKTINGRYERGVRGKALLEPNHSGRFDGCYTEY